MVVFDRAKRYLTEGNKRSILVKKNILGIGVFKLISVILSFLLVPMTIKYVDATQYGIWLTLSSVIGWLSFFDIGLSNGLRNRFAQAKARDNTDLARQYVSTTYAILSFIFIPILVISVLISSYLNWGKVLNIDVTSINRFFVIVDIILVYFCLKFILSTINIILIADQRPAEASFRSLVEQTVSLIVIFIMTKTIDGSLMNLSIALCLIPILVLVVFNIALFRTRYRKYSPSIKFINFRLASDIFSLGFKFFVIQISGIIKYQTANIIIIRSFGALEVTNYNIAYKYFSVLPMIWNIFATPIWSSVTDAFEKNEIDWIKAIEKKMRILTLMLGIAGLIMLILANPVYDLWIGKGVVDIVFMLSLWAFLYNITIVYGGTFVQILNGLGYLKVQFMSTIAALFIFLIILFLLIKVFNLGAYSVLIAGTLSNFNGYFLAPYQYRQVFIHKKKGIWVK